MLQKLTVSIAWLTMSLVTKANISQSKCPSLVLPDLPLNKLEAAEGSTVCVRFYIADVGCNATTDDILIRLSQENKSSITHRDLNCELKCINKTCTTNFPRNSQMCRCGQGIQNCLFEKTVFAKDTGIWIWEVLRDVLLQEKVFFNITPATSSVQTTHDGGFEPSPCHTGLPKLTGNYSTVLMNRTLMIQFPLTSFSTSLTQCVVMPHQTWHLDIESISSPINCSGLGYEVTGESPQLKLTLNLSGITLEQCLIGRLFISNRFGSDDTEFYLNLTTIIGDLTTNMTGLHTKMNVMIGVATMSCLLFVTTIIIVIALHAFRKGRRSKTATDKLSDGDSLPLCDRSRNTENNVYITNHPEIYPRSESQTTLEEQRSEYASTSEVIDDYAAKSAYVYQTLPEPLAQSPQDVLRICPDGAYSFIK